MNYEAVSKLSIVELFGLAEACKQSGQRAAVVNLYKTWIISHETDPSLYAAYFNYGTALNEEGDYAGAVMALKEAARLHPDFHQAKLSLGMVLEKLGQPGQGVMQWLDVSNSLGAVTGDSLTHKIMALENTGRVLEGLEQDGAAEDALRGRLELGLDDRVIQHWLALRMRQCKWPVVEPNARLKRRDLLAGISPLSLACLADDPLFQLAKAYHYNKTLIGNPLSAPALLPPAQQRPRTAGRLRIGYVSSDLREHAVGFSTVEVYELHDREKFEVFAYYCGIEREDPTKARIRSAVDHWLNINGMSDEQVAGQIQADGIDILVDLNGYTKDARTRVFALRPAPIAVNWFGFPNTMGSPHHHYLVADAHVIPHGSERFYSEKIVRLPCYQSNDRSRVVAEPPPRATEGLPEDAVVFCSLNGLQKLTERTFDRWLSILNQVPNSVLWLLGGTADTRQRLRNHAAGKGIAGERLIFADKRVNPEHVARYALADLFLDHGPYGAHTTAADALWMGVPVLTCPGRSFAARVCSSLVSAAGLDELICESPEAYVAKAVELGTDRVKLMALRQRLEAGRDTCLLFDSPRFVAGLEDLYQGMWADYESGNLPVPDLRNLDIYHEIALSTAAEDAELLSDEAYDALYAGKLEEWSRIYPVASDSRVRGDVTVAEKGASSVGAERRLKLVG